MTSGLCGRGVLVHGPLRPSRRSHACVPSGLVVNEDGMSLHPSEESLTDAIEDLIRASYCPSGCGTRGFAEVFASRKVWNGRFGTFGPCHVFGPLRSQSARCIAVRIFPWRHSTSRFLVALVQHVQLVEAEIERGLVQLVQLVWLGVSVVVSVPSICISTSRTIIEGQSISLFWGH